MIWIVSPKVHRLKPWSSPNTSEWGCIWRYGLKRSNKGKLRSLRVNPSPMWLVSFSERVRTQKCTKGHYSMSDSPTSSHVWTWGDHGVYTPRRETSGGTSLCPTWISASQTPGMGDNKCQLWKPSHLWYFVMGTLANQRSTQEILIRVHQTFLLWKRKETTISGNADFLGKLALCYPLWHCDFNVDMIKISTNNEHL